MGFFVSLIWFAASWVLSWLTRPRPEHQNQKPKGLDEFNAPTATEGRPVPVIWGRVQLTGPNVVWYGDLRTSALTKDDNIVAFRYYVGVQYALCRGEIDGFRRIWADDKLIYTSPITTPGAYSVDEPDFWGGEGDDTNNAGGLVFGGNVYFGTTTQAADTYLTDSSRGAGNYQNLAIGYRGTAYVTVEQGWVGNRPSIPAFKFEVERYPSALLDSGDQGVGYTGTKYRVGDAANPMEVLYELITNSEYGMDEGSSKVNLANFQAHAATLYDEGNGVTYIWSATQDIDKVIDEVENQINGTLYVDPETGKYEVALVRDDYVLASQPLLDESNIVKFVNFSRPAWNETTNYVRVKFLDVRKEYKESYAIANDMANLEINQTVLMTEIYYPMCGSASLANWLAWRDLRESSYPSASLTLEVNREMYGVQIGDVLRVTYDRYGLEDFPLRVTRVDYGALSEGRIRIEGVEDIYTADNASFGDPQDTGWSDPSAEPDPYETDEQFAIEAPMVFTNSLGTQSSPYFSFVSPDESTFPNILAGARALGGSAVKFDVKYRQSSGTPSGSYTALDDTILGSCHRGALRSSLSGLNSSYPQYGTPDIAIDNDGSTDALDLGQQLPIGDPVSGNDFTILAVISPGTSTEEWIVFTGIQDNTTYITLTDCYRGALDSQVHAHSAGAPVWFVWARRKTGWGATEEAIPFMSRNYEVKLIPSSQSQTLADGDATACTIFAVGADARCLAPLTPNELNVNGSRYPGTVSAQYDPGAGQGLYFTYTPRTWRMMLPKYQALGYMDGGAPYHTPEPFVVGSEADNLTYNWWLHDMDTYSEPTSRSNASLSGTGVAADNFSITRAAIVGAIGSVPSSLKIEIEAQHDPDGYTPTGVTSINALEYTFSVTDP